MVVSDMNDIQGVPGFLHKLWSMLENLNNSGIISWSINGESFVVKDEALFARELLPKYFKHNKMTSFIRQLNMYGFNKITRDPTQSSLTHLYGSGPIGKEAIEFYHPDFKKNHPEQLTYIKRKPIGQSENNQLVKVGQDDVNKLLGEINQLKRKQENFSHQLSESRRENDMLWTELHDLRRKHEEQEHIVRKIANFLFSKFFNKTHPIQGTNGSRKRQIPMLEGPSNEANVEDVTGYDAIGEILKRDATNDVPGPAPKLTKVGKFSPYVIQTPKSPPVYSVSSPSGAQQFLNSSSLSELFDIATPNVPPRLPSNTQLALENRATDTNRSVTTSSQMVNPNLLLDSTPPMPSSTPTRDFFANHISDVDSNLNAIKSSLYDPNLGLDEPSLMDLFESSNSRSSPFPLDDLDTKKSTPPVPDEFV